MYERAQASQQQAGAEEPSTNGAGSHADEEEVVDAEVVDESK
jgi:hypothetical protein